MNNEIHVESGESFSPEERATLRRIIGSRRDVRKFRSDPIPEESLWRMLEAAHAAPSVGFSQPWDFILIDSREIRQSIHDNFVAVNEREKNRVEPGQRRELYSSLKLEGILESPLNLAVTCCHAKEKEFVLGVGTMPQMISYSVCLAVQNLWLTARAEGIGVGWVSIVEPGPVKQLLGLPDHVELIAYLCIGYPQEFRSRPLLEEVGWKPREDLEKHLFRNRWGQKEKTEGF
jgi:5,6-dimethylbenzimidazole synthase